MARTLENTGYRWEVYDDDFLVAHIVPHDSGTGWSLVDLRGHAFSIRSYETPESAADYLPELGTTAYNVVQRGTAGRTYWCIEVRSQEHPRHLWPTSFDRREDAEAEAARLNADQIHRTDPIGR